MTLSLTGITIDANDVERVAQFWSEALSWENKGTSGPFTALVRPGGGDPHILIQQVPEPKTAKTRLHLDFATADRQAEVQRLVGLGATVVAEVHESPTWTVLADPEGTEFCVVQRG